MTEEEARRAKKTYDTLCGVLDSDELQYEKDEEKLTIRFGIRGEDIPMDILVRIDAERQLITLLSHLPFTISEEKRLEVAIAVSVVNYKLADGSFDFDVTDGHMFFRMTSSFIESDIGSELFNYMIAISLHTIDDYNDKFLMLDKGLISIEKFME